MVKRRYLMQNNLSSSRNLAQQKMPLSDIWSTWCGTTMWRRNDFADPKIITDTSPRPIWRIWGVLEWRGRSSGSISIRASAASRIRPNWLVSHCRRSINIDQFALINTDGWISFAGSANFLSDPFKLNRMWLSEKPTPLTWALTALPSLSRFTLSERVVRYAAMVACGINHLLIIIALAQQYRSIETTSW